MLLWGLIAAGGCGGRAGECASAWDKVNELQTENNDLRQQIRDLAAENEELSSQMNGLSGLDPQIRKDAIDRLQRIQIGRLSGLEDTDGNGQPDTLIVHLEPIDTAQDRVKTPGAVQIELWDLSRRPKEAKLAEWQIAPSELIKYWGSSLFGNYYRLQLPAGDLPQDLKELTVKAVFTDFLTGKVLRTQTVLNTQSR